MTPLDRTPDGDDFSDEIVTEPIDIHGQRSRRSRSPATGRSDQRIRRPTGGVDVSPTASGPGSLDTQAAQYLYRRSLVVPQLGHSTAADHTDRSAPAAGVTPSSVLCVDQYV